MKRHDSYDPPGVIGPRPHKRKAPVPLILEDIEWMAEHGESLDGAARRLGLLPPTLTKKLRGMGRIDLSDSLIANNPHDWNRMRGSDPIPVAYPHAKAAKESRRNEKRKARRREQVAA